MSFTKAGNQQGKCTSLCDDNETTTTTFNLKPQVIRIGVKYAQLTETVHSRPTSDTFDLKMYLLYICVQW